MHQGIKDMFLPLPSSLLPQFPLLSPCVSLSLKTPTTFLAHCLGSGDRIFVRILLAFGTEAPYKSARHFVVKRSHYQHSLLLRFMNASLSFQKHFRWSNVVIEHVGGFCLCAWPWLWQCEVPTGELKTLIYGVDWRWKLLLLWVAGFVLSRWKSSEIDKWFNYPIQLSWSFFSLLDA